LVGTPRRTAKGFEHKSTFFAGRAIDKDLEINAAGA
jgi:hypothetical protein